MKALNAPSQRIVGLFPRTLYGFSFPAGHTHTAEKMANIVHTPTWEFKPMHRLQRSSTGEYRRCRMFPDYDVYRRRTPLSMNALERKLCYSYTRANVAWTLHCSIACTINCACRWKEKKWDTLWAACLTFPNVPDACPPDLQRPARS